MPYELNPHRHVKIWLSKDPDIFLNHENQLRLVKMRVKNPGDTIHLVYAKKLLSGKAWNELTDFCKKHAIIPVSIEEEILPKCISNEYERNLAVIYELEINALNDGGNVAAASDILRWLSPVYSLGIYSDFDVVIDTTKLAPSISVDAPILLKIGSIKIPISGLPKKNDLESLSLNNDSIAVVGEDPLAIKTIQKIQQRIYNAYLNPEVYTDILGKTFSDISLYVNKQLHDGVNGIFIAAQFLQQCNNVHVLELASGLGLVNPDPIALRKAILDKTISSTVDFRPNLAKIRAELEQKTFSYFIAPMEREKFTKYLTMPDAELIARLEEDYSQELIKHSVIHTTGPGAILFGLFGRCAISAEIINVDIKPYSFQHYGLLNEAFYSENGSDFHLSPQDNLRKTTQQVGERGDQSWLKAGATAITKREEKMHQAANTVQKIFRGRQGRKIASEEKQRQNAAKASDTRPAFFHDSEDKTKSEPASKLNMTESESDPKPPG